MTLLDVLLLFGLALSASAGHRMGFLVRAAGIFGFIGGLALSVVTVPLAVEALAPATAIGRLVGTLAVTVLTIIVLSFVAQSIAVVGRRAIAGTPLSGVDRVGGAVAGIVGTLVLVWFAAPLAGSIPGTLSRQVRGSAIVGLVNDAAPNTPNPLAALQTLLADTRFPEVFSDLAPAPATQPPPEAIPVDQSVVDATAASTVKIEAAGCGSAFAGSGWAVRENLVVTNAHVVAGADAVQVLRPDGSRVDGEVIVFDDDRDLALVRVPGLGMTPLQLGTADDGEGAAAFGHPGGQEQLRVAPARVESTITATGRDIYGRDRTQREVVVLGARLAQGDSGSAVVDADGTVVATVFAISPDRPGTAYALANSEVTAVLDADRRPGVSGRCS